MSEIKDLIQRIDREASAMYQGMYGLAQTARHDFIHARYRAIDEQQAQLENLIGDAAYSLTDALMESRRKLVELEHQVYVQTYPQANML